MQQRFVGVTLIFILLLNPCLEVWNIWPIKQNRTYGIFQFWEGLIALKNYRQVYSKRDLWCIRHSMITCAVSSMHACVLFTHAKLQMRIRTKFRDWKVVWFEMLKMKSWKHSRQFASLWLYSQAARGEFMCSVRVRREMREKERL